MAKYRRLGVNSYIIASIRFFKIRDESEIWAKGIEHNYYNNSGFVERLPSDRYFLHII